jgi:hypothetical protein
LFLQLLTVLAEKPPASAGYRGSDLVPWRIPGSRLNPMRHLMRPAASPERLPRRA